MATAFQKKRRIQPGETAHKFGHCMGPIGAVLQHQPLGPNEEPVEPLDINGNRIPGFCPGVRTSSATIKQYPAGTKVYCQCSCHGPDQPEAWPGYNESRADFIADESDDDDDDDESPQTAEAGEVTVDAPAAQDPASVEALTGVVMPPETDQEPPLPQLGNPSEEESEAVQDAPVSAPTAAWTDDGFERTETKSFAYPNGSVTRTERASVTRQGKDVTLVEWIAKLPDGTKIGTPQWSRKAAKDLLP